MTEYYILMALILLPVYPVFFCSPTAKKRIIYIAVVFAYMFILSGLRYSVGNDYYHYRDYFYDMISSGLSFKEAVSSLPLEPGYIFLMKLVEWSGGEYLHLNILTAFITLLPAAYVICRYSKAPYISCWLYLTITFFYNSMNFTRQSIAAAIFFLSCGAIMKKKHWLVIPAALIGSLFHTSVLLMIPAYLISLIKPSAKSLGIIGGCGVLMFIFSEKAIDLAVTYIFPSYAKYADSVFLTAGLSPKFLLIPAFLAILIISAYFLGMKKTHPEAAVFVNFIFYNFIIWLFIVKHFILERFTLPIYIFTLISLPMALEFFGDLIKQRELVRRIGKVCQRLICPLLAAAVILPTYIYNSFCVSQGAHGVFPYRSVIKPQSRVTAEDLALRPRAYYVNAYFLDFLYCASMRDYTIILCVKGDAGDSLELPQRLWLKRLGFQTDLTALNGSSYIGVASGGRAVFEMAENELIAENMSLYDGKYTFTAVSGGTDYGNIASLMINGREFMPNENGLNFALFDNELQRIVTAQGYDTTDHDYAYCHSNGFNGIEYDPAFMEDFQGDY